MSSAIVYGTPPAGLIPVPPDAVQTSPLMVGAHDLENLPDQSLAHALLYAPRGTIERRFVLAHALRALQPGGELIALAPNDRGGTRLKKELEHFGVEPTIRSEAHHRIASCVRGDAVANIGEAIEDGGPQFVESLNMWSQPGVFSWDRIDSGSALLLQCLPPLSGAGADFGAGVGLLAKEILNQERVSALTLIELDRRACDAAKKNITDPRASILWNDVVAADLQGLDFVITNPPFHSGGRNDITLGQRFIAKAAAALRKGGTCLLVANRQLPYEAVIKEHFVDMEQLADRDGYKVLRATK